MYFRGQKLLHLEVYHIPQSQMVTRLTFFYLFLKKNTLNVLKYSKCFVPLKYQILNLPIEVLYRNRMKNQNASQKCIRTYQNNQIIKAYVDKSEKYKGYMPKHQINKLVESSFDDSFDFNPELHSWVKETQEGNYLLVNKFSNGKLQGWYVNEFHNVLRGISDVDSEIEFSESWDSSWEIIPKVTVLGKYRVSKLKCPRKLSMARFRNYCTVPSDGFLEAFFDNGGSVDGGGWSEPVWGFYPATLAGLEEQGIDPSLLGRVFSVIGRVDYGHHYHIIEMAQLGLEPRTRKEYGRNCCGISRRNLLEKFGVSHNKGIITLGYMPVEKFVRLLLSKATICSYDLMINDLYYDRFDSHIDIDSCIAQLGHANSLMKYWIECRVKYHKRRENRTSVKKRRYELKSQKAIEWCFRTNRSVKINNTQRAYVEDYHYQRTSIGDVHYTAEGIDFSLRGLISVHKVKSGFATVYCSNQAKRFKDYWVARERNLKADKDVFFIWKDSFKDHIEANSLREGLELIQKRIKKASLILCLNDVRNDKTGTAGYCLAGTKSFAQARMPFLHRLISKYQEWRDIPTDIMELEFHLASKTIFDGFRNPVS